MRLKQIKLAGFKSFVDPTSFDVPSQRVGVVGPNGCGKSNLIDAVRWVLGESRAAELRGDSMQDVIFNGSESRRPAGRASVELVFDNAAGRAGGAWARFAELSVRRVLTRDGQSAYQINNQAVRRRDVQDVFLGTGLGPRAYAIIGQGTVSRILEARPDELRVFLEEAAGVSRYRERRRETGQRLADARDNLARVDDVLRELAAQIERLARQAEVAERFGALQAERAERQQSLWLVERDAAAARAAHARGQAAAAQAELDAHAAAQADADASLQRLGAEREAAEAALHAAQAAFYESAGRIAQLQERLRALEQARSQAGRERDAARARSEALAAQRAVLAQALQPARQEAAEAARAERALAEAFAAAAAQQPVHEQAAAQAAAALQAARAEAAATAHAIELAATRERAAESSAAALALRAERLRREREALSPPAEPALREAAALLEGAQREEQRLAAALAQADAARPALDAARTEAQRRLRDAQTQLAQTEARSAALAQLQQRVRQRGAIGPWLARHGLADAPPLWRRLRVEPGWEIALEAVLRERLAALDAGDPAQLATLAAEAPPARCAFFAAGALGERAGAAGAGAGVGGPVDPVFSVHGPSGAAGDQSAPCSGTLSDTTSAAPSAGSFAGRALPVPPAGARPEPLRDPAIVPLARHVRAIDAGTRALLADWLHGVYAAESAEAAARLQPQLPDGAVLVLRDGHAMRRGSVQLHAPDGEEDGLLVRQREIERLAEAARSQREAAEGARTAAQRSEAALSEHESARRALREAHARAMRDATAALLAHERLQQAGRQAKQARARLDAELAETDQAAQAQRCAARTEADRAQADRLRLRAQRGALDDLARRDQQAREALAQARERLRRCELDAQRAAFAHRAAAARADGIARDLDGARGQIEQAREQADAAQARLDALHEAPARAALEQAQAQRTGREQALAGARAGLEAPVARIRDAERARLLAERAQVPLREQAARLQLDEQAARLAAEGFAAQLAEAGCNERAVRAGWPSVPEPARLQRRIAQLAAEIAALGAVNLAALDELRAARERERFLGAQAADLREAVATLEDAIRRIDRETRALLRETFERVDAEFGRLFPQLFGGGRARLELTGDEILDSGVTVTAQPPGKRNGTIALLSGGEKALAAIALVFAMFQLNPAPFCLLDEVDAPLDDANTERYAGLVRAMSAQTQFLFITHNKIAMEMAQHLVGVTMQERGVSRIVAVDLQAAGRLAEAA